jgi:hypothetical protein
MNLWVKRTGLLVVVTLFLMACEDEKSLLGFRNPQSKFDVNFFDVPLESTVLLIDSVRTDNQQTGVTNRLLVGSYNDPLLGEVSATTYMQLRPSLLDTIPPTSVYDSLVFEIQLDNYAFGAEGITSESFSIHEITEDSISFSIPIKPYYYYNSLGYGGSMADATYSIDYDSLRKLAGQSRPDTAYTVRVRLNENTDFNARIFDLLKNNPNNALKDLKKFRYAVKGLALVPESPSHSIIGFTGSSLAKSRLTLYYHTATDTLTRDFFFDSGSFININTNRIGDLAGAPLYQSIEPSTNLRYQQNGSPVITRIDLSAFYDYIETVPNTIFNSAELIIETESPGVYTPPASLLLRTMKENNLFFNQRKTADKDFMAKHFVLTDNEYYVARSDVSSSSQTLPVSLLYASGKYTGNMTLFIQSLFDKKEDAEKLRYLGLYNTNIGKTVNRVAFHKDKVKLRLYYTVPSTQ